MLLEKHWAFSDVPETRNIWDMLQVCIEKNDPVVLISSLAFEKENIDENKTPLLFLPEKDETFGNLLINRELATKMAMASYKRRENSIVEIGGKNFFIQIFPRQDQLLIIGAGHISIPLVRFAKELDFLTAVIDPRSVFSNLERFDIPPDKLINKWPDQVLNDWPLNEDTYALLLTHDPKIDDPALQILLKHNLSYIGALGSKRTHAKRCIRLESAGIKKDSIKKIKGPAGTDIGAQTAAEIALSMIAEVIAAKRGRI